MEEMRARTDADGKAFAKTREACFLIRHNEDQLRRKEGLKKGRTEGGKGN